MRLTPLSTLITTTLILSGCAHKGTNPADPYEPLNRKVYQFNNAVDGALLKPTAKAYQTIIPGFIRKGVNNFFNNLDMIPSVANDILQAEGKWAIKDTWRFIMNSTLGFAGVFDAAELCGLPAHYNDVGLTLAKWGDKQSPYLVLPLLGPSTLRDGSGMLFQFALWSPYVYINNDPVAYGLAGLRYVDLRTQLLESERIMDEAFDKYSFMRDAYLQHRAYQIVSASQEINKSTASTESASATALQDAPSDYVEE